MILGVGYTDEVNAVVYGKDGLLDNLAKGAIIAVSSTTSPFVVQEIAAAAKPKGIGVLDAPICRGRFAADEGTLLALVGGEPDVVERGRAVYGTFCSDYAHLGNVGHGQVGKTMNNLLLWINAVGLIEAGRLAETTGIDLVKLRDALMMSSGASDALKEWDMISFTWALKDMQVVTEMTDKAGLSLPVTGAIKELVKEARRIKASNPPNWTGKGPTKYRLGSRYRRAVDARSMTRRCAEQLDWSALLRPARIAGAGRRDWKHPRINRCRSFAAASKSFAVSAATLDGDAGLQQ